jgi:DNA-binding MarR family transcriptional regulator
VLDQFSGDGIVLDNALAFWMYRAHQALRNESYREFRERGIELTPEQWMILVRLWEREGRSQNDLCDSTFRDRPTMSRILDGMERRGFVVRRADPNDKRSRLVYLTPSALGLKKQLVPVVRKIVTRALHGVSRHELETTRQTLRRIFENLES